MTNQKVVHLSSYAFTYNTTTQASTLAGYVLRS